jgi:histidinol dehydrogenase
MVFNMKIFKYPAKETWSDLLKRPTLDVEALRGTVSEVLQRVRTEGDRAVKEYEEKFDKVQLTTLSVTPEEMEEGVARVSPDLKSAIELAHANIEKFHTAQRFEGKPVETKPGVTCWQKAVAIEKV